MQLCYLVSRKVGTDSQNTKHKVHDKKKTEEVKKYPLVEHMLRTEQTKIVTAYSPSRIRSNNPTKKESVCSKLRQGSQIPLSYY